MIKWWGYIHVNGSIHVKRYFSELDTDEAEDSPFVAQVIYPFKAYNREDAIIYVQHQQRR